MTGYRVAFKRKFVFDTQEILEVAKKAEAEIAEKRANKKRILRSRISGIGFEVDEVI
jgi:hypothetical protein